jgi:hypothetical protein
MMITIVDLSAEILHQIFDAITDRLDEWDLEELRTKSHLAIAVTCKLFNEIVSPIIYRYAGWWAMEEQFDLFQNSLVMNPGNAKHIRFVTAEIESNLKFLLTFAPLDLKELSMKIISPGSWSILQSMHPETRIAALKLGSGHYRDDPFKAPIISIISQLRTTEAFSILTTLHIKDRTKQVQITAQEIVDNLTCPTLTTLKITLHEYRSFTLPADRLLALREISYFYWSFKGEVLADPKESTQLHDVLLAMMERNIRYQACRKMDLDGQSYTLSLFQPVISNCAAFGIDPRPLVKWLITSHFTINPYLTSLSLVKLNTGDRNCILHVLNDMFEQHFPLKYLQLCVEDDSTLATRIPQYITKLELNVVNHVSPLLIPAIISSLPGLSKVCITMVGGLPDVLNDGHPESSCTRLPFVRPLAADILHAESIVFVCTRGGSIQFCALRPDDETGLRQFPLNVFDREVQVREFLEEIVSWIAGRDVFLGMAFHGPYSPLAHVRWEYMLD